MKTHLYEIIREAGSLVLQNFGDTRYETKDDASPLTEADKISHIFLVKALQQLKNLPVLSEEQIVNYEIRKNWNEFWMIDPLDGTKEFLNGQKDFSINIAPITESKPSLRIDIFSRT